jgi:radical SAM superfamily enzyme YgiQ (UPF0313 family)
MAERKQKEGKGRLKTLLINPSTRVDMPAYAYPAGLGYIAAVLRENKFPVTVLDIDAFRYSDDEIKKKLKEIDYDAIGIGGIVTSYKYVKWLIREIRKIKPKTKIIIGGNLGSSIPELLFKHTDADIIVHGEGETTILDLYKNIDSPEKVNGIYYRKAGKIIKTPPRELISDLDTLPYPSYDLFPTDKYASTKAGVECEGITKSLHVVSHRGCPYRCIFCYHKGEKVRMRKPEEIIKELRFLKDDYGIQFVSFSAETFIVNKKWTLEFCKLMKKSGLGIRWSCMGRVNLVDEDFLKEMKSAGCTYIGYGIESASQKMLDAMKKDCTVAQQKNAIRLTKKLGIQTYPTFIIGTPGETKETVKESIDFCKELSLIPEFFFMTPFPNTELYTYAMNKRLIKDEDKYIENLGECRELRINLTEMTNEELINLKKKAEKELYINFMIKHPFITLKKVIRLYRYYGFKYISSTINRRIEAIMNRKS